MSKQLIVRAVTATLAVVLARLGFAAPVVSSFSPDVGRPGTQVTVNGADFSAATRVEFGGVAADFVVAAPNRIVATVPPEALSGKIRVSTPAVFGESAAPFAVAPRVIRVDPARGATNVFVTIEGFNFVGATEVRFSQNQTSVFTVTTPSQIRVRVPAGATNGPITVVTPAGSDTTLNAFLVTSPVPVIDSFSPVLGAPGTQVLIEGINFINLTGVKFGNADATMFAAPTSGQITTVVPTNATTGRITVTTSGGTAVSVNDFTVTLAPVITNVIPAFGVVGTPVVIEGINFTGFTGVGFNGKAASGFLTTPNQISTSVPPDVTNGPVRITVTNNASVGVSSNHFVVTRAPIIDSFEPDNGNPGMPVTIYGANLSNGPTVLKIGGTNAPFVVTGQNGTQIRATVPNGAQTGPIHMTNSYGSFTTTSNFYVPGSAPFVSGFSPARGPRGAEVLISGWNFAAPVTVKFNGVVDPTATATTLTQIRATVPAAATTGPITVSTGAGTSTNANLFYLPPRVASFTPTTGIVGTNVVLTGANFTNTTEVWFNTATAEFSVNASNVLTAVVPTNASTGPLTVVTPGGAFVSTNHFRVQPNITSFEPTLGPVGTVVTIYGTSFLNVNSVVFNNGNAAFTNISSTELRATVPVNGSTGPIRVTTPDGTAVSATNFIVTTIADLGISLASSPAILSPGESLVYHLVATNKGPSIVTGAVVTNTLPAGVMYVAATSSRGLCTETNGVVTCQIGNFTNGTSVSITIDAVPQVEGNLVNTARIRAIELDPSGSDNSASVSNLVVSAASRTLGIIVQPGGSNVVVSWPVSPLSFTLQFLNAFSISNAWQPVTPPPTVVNGQYVATNRADGEKRFYRLERP